MDSEEQILHYYLKVYSFIFFVLIFLIFFYSIYVLNKNIGLKNNYINIEKGERVDDILNKNTINLSNLEKYIISTYYKLNYIFSKKFVHFGDFYLRKNISSFEFFNTITKSSNLINKITIIEGWSKNILKKNFSKHFINFDDIRYEDIIADTYYVEKYLGFFKFHEDLKLIKRQYFEKNKNNKISKLFSQKEIMIIGSLIEKEGLDTDDKRKISSVIMNRLKKNMKLQIDATVIFAITNGQYNLQRKLLISDLKFNHPFNTYVYKGLPPEPISYVGKKTLDIIFENYKTDFLFYFYDNSLKRHIFSKTFEEHKKKLNEYRNR